MIRPLAPADVPALAAINAACLPAVSEETDASLAAIFALGEVWVAAEDAGAPLGFLSLIQAGTRGYDSPNLAWFEARAAAGGEADFVYVDRIALAPAARGRGLGEALYAHAVDRWSGQRAAMVCEVNTVPPNPSSLRFHARLGFTEVGRAAHDPGRYEVAFLEKRLA